MFKLVKYELRSTFFTILGICISVIAANLFLMTKKNSWDNDAIIGLSVTLVIGAMIVIFISSLKIMSKYLHGHEGYLLFTLPKSGTTIITSRIITALIQTTIVAFVSLLMLYLTIPVEIDLSFLKDIKLSVILFSIVLPIGGMVSSLTFIYFCMVIGKVALKGKKLGKIGSFIIFIILSGLTSWLSYKIGTIFPQTINLTGSSIFNSFRSTAPGLTISGGVLNINIAEIIFEIVTFIGFFISSSYLIDNKLDLS
jgi:ABC-2 type transport system permease protein